MGAILSEDLAEGAFYPFRKHSGEHLPQAACFAQSTWSLYKFTGVRRRQLSRVPSCAKVGVISNEDIWLICLSRTRLLLSSVSPV